MDFWNVCFLWTLITLLFNWTWCKTRNTQDSHFYVTENALARRFETVYTLIKDDLTQTDALQACTIAFGQYGGTLAKLNDMDTVEIIFKTLSSAITEFWTGLSCETQDCKRRFWSDCTEFDGDSSLKDDKPGLCYFASRQTPTELTRDACSKKRYYVCQYTNPYSKGCDNTCNRSSGKNMCLQSGKSIQLSTSNDKTCYSQCAQTQGCWIFWDADRDTCLFAVSQCITVNVSNVAVKVPNGQSSVTATCLSTTAVKDDNCVVSTITVVPSGDQLCATTVTTTAPASVDPVTVTVTATATAALVTTTLTLLQVTTVTSLQVTTATQQQPGTPLWEKVTVYQTQCSETLTLHSWLSSDCSYMTTLKTEAPNLMTSFQTAPTGTSLLASPTTGNAPSPSSLAGTQTPALNVTLTEEQVSLATSFYATATPASVQALPDSVRESMTSSIVQELTVPAVNLSKTKRLKISVYDNRTSSTVSGVSACIFMGLTLACFVAADLTRIYLYVLHLVQRLKS